MFLAILPIGKQSSYNHLIYLFIRAECESQVKGFPGARYKKFGSEDEAHNFIEQVAVCCFN